MKPLHRTILLTTLGLLLAAGLIVLVMLSRRSYDGNLCKGMKIEIKQDKDGVLTEDDVKEYIVSHLTPCKNKPVEQIDLAEMERQLTLMPLIGHVECYIDNKGYLQTQITEAIPVMHVLGGNHDYCVDSEARQIATPKKLRKGVALVDGANVSLQFATGDLFNLVCYMQQNGWSSEFTRFQVGSGNKVRMKSEKYGYWVCMGQPTEFERKFNKLVRFRKKEPGHTAYKEINLDYYGQVVCK